jgi:alkaline phosphatase D
MMPLRKRSLPIGPDMQLYRTVSFGRLATFQVLDVRQYRSPLPNGGKASDLNDEALRRSNTMLGAKQARWLRSALLESTSAWNVLAQQLMMGMVDVSGGDEKKYSMDQWPGYAHERIKLVEFIAERRVPNPVVITGDIHSNWANELRVDDRKPESPVVGAEFVGTSISSGGNGSKGVKELERLQRENACVKFHNRERGYVRCTVNAKTWRSDYQVVDEVEKPGGSITTRASLVVEAGDSRIKPA